MSEALLGELRLFAGAKPPRGWLICDGTLLKANEFSALFNLIGYSFGGRSPEFAVPDFRGRLPVGAGFSGETPNAIAVGEMGGTETVTMSAAAMPPHTHAYPLTETSLSVEMLATHGNSATPHRDNTMGTTHSKASSGTLGTVTQYAGPGAGGLVALGGLGLASDGDNDTGVTGGGEARTNMMPYVCINVIIAVEGLHP